jgi:hypothetical protein
VQVNQYDGSGKLTNSYTERDEFVIVNSKKLLSLNIRYDSDGKESSKFESEYNSKGLEVKSVYYSYSTNGYRKSYEITYTYTYKEINTTAIYEKQKTLLNNNFQISRNSNSLKLNFADNSQKRIEIVNLQGKTLKSQKFSAKIHNVNISNLPKSVYILRVFENEKANSVKFVKE